MWFGEGFLQVIGYCCIYKIRFLFEVTAFQSDILLDVAIGMNDIKRQGFIFDFGEDA